MMKSDHSGSIGIYPGSFDPVTFGHLDIIKRASALFDELIVGVLVNGNKKSLFSIDERVMMLRDVTTGLHNVKITSFSGLTVDFARECGAHVLVRGLRAVTDFENELSMAQTNHAMNKEIETIFFATDLRYSYLSSSVVREVAEHGGDISLFVPERIIPVLRNKFRFPAEEGL